MLSKFKNFFTIGILLMLAILLNACNSKNDTTTETEIPTATTLNVDYAVRNLKPDTTVRTVVGVVQTVSPSVELLTLIDVDEYKICGLSDCCLYLPVQWQGEMPSVEDIVTVQGKIESTGSGMVFLADKLHIDGSAASQ